MHHDLISWVVIRWIKGAFGAKATRRYSFQHSCSRYTVCQHHVCSFFSSLYFMASESIDAPKMSFTPVLALGGANCSWCSTRSGEAQKHPPTCFVTDRYSDHHRLIVVVHHTPTQRSIGLTQLWIRSNRPPGLKG